MYCTACGTAIPEGQAACPQCGQPIPASLHQPPPEPPSPPAQPSALPPIHALEVEQYRSHIRILAIAWFVYAVLSLVMGFAGVGFTRVFLMSSEFQYRMHGHRIPPGMIPWAMHLAWVAVALRTVLAAVTGWGLMQFARWGRIFAIVIAILSLFRIPLGTALGVWTLVMLLGYRHTKLYEQL